MYAEAGDIDTAMVLLRMPSGALCHIENGRRAVYGFDERIEVFGAKGMLKSRPPALSSVDRFAASGIRSERYPDLYGEASFAGLLDSFVTDLAAGRPVSPTLAEGLQAQIIAEAAVESLRRNRPVEISLSTAGGRDPLTGAASKGAAWPSSLVARSRA